MANTSEYTELILNAQDDTNLDRIVDAALTCITRFGMTKTSVEDIAKEAKCSRATIYRMFPGGKDSILEAVVASELGKFYSAVEERVARIDTLEDAISAVINEAGLRLINNPALATVITLEPEVILPLLAFERMNQLLEFARLIGRHLLERWIVDEKSERIAEWIARIVISYSATPAQYFDITDIDSVKKLVNLFVMPGISVMNGNTQPSNG